MTRLITREMYEEQVREMEKRLEAEGKYIDRIDEDGEIYREEFVEENMNMRSRILKKKKSLIENKYVKYFDKIGEFESSLEQKFTETMEKNLFYGTFSTETWIEIPFDSEGEKKFLMEYISKITPMGIAHAEKEGMTMKIKVLLEKHKIKINLQYSIDLGMSLEEMLNM